MNNPTVNKRILPCLVFGVLAASNSVIATSEDSADDADLQYYLQRGQEIALSAKSALGSQLMQAIAEGGAVHAIDFCNDNAGPIGQRIAAEHDAGVRRVTDRPRNPGNAANADERAYINQASATLARGEQPKPTVSEHEGQIRAYYPIVTNAMCLQCHGSRDTDIAADTLRALQARYPNDQAWGYGVNELRGIFVITMKELTRR